MRETRRIMVIYGTRPEAVKVAPLIRALDESEFFMPQVTVTAQHRSMLDQVNDFFGIKPEFDLDIHPRADAVQVTTRALTGAQALLAGQQPDAVVVQGDTTTVFAAALAAFYEKIPVVHLEAGLRTGNPYSPYPEEINRQLATRLAALHLAPTATSKANLLAENVDPASVVVTGNTVIDALLWTVHGQPRPAYGDPALDRLDRTDAPVLLVTAHRRESWGEPLRAIGRALARIAGEHAGLQIVFPIHRNPLVRDAIMPAVQGLPNVIVTEPLPYAGFARLMNRSTVILTDSGGVQEEGPSLGKPVLVMRDTTERPEAVSAGTVRLVGTGEDRIVAEVGLLLTDLAAYAAMANAVNPYGDGQAAGRGVAALAHHFRLGPPAEEFTTGPAQPKEGSRYHVQPPKKPIPDSRGRRRRARGAAGRVDSPGQRRAVRGRQRRAGQPDARRPGRLEQDAGPPGAAEAAQGPAQGAEGLQGPDRPPPQARSGDRGRGTAGVRRSARPGRPVAGGDLGHQQPRHGEHPRRVRHDRHLGMARRAVRDGRRQPGQPLRFGDRRAGRRLRSGQVNDYTATIYLGSTYNEPIPTAFLNDVLTTTHPVIWAGDNIWQLSGTEGSAADTAFKAAYGWDPSNSYFDSVDNPLTVSYKGQTFTRNSDNGPDVLGPDITTPSLVSVLASANCTNSSGAPVNCAPIAQSTGTSFPWAIRSANLTYVGEIPFSYIGETDRYVAFSDLLFPALAPTATPSHVALVRLEDVSATDDPSQITAIAAYLKSQGVPFSVNVIPQYLDPNGYYNNGVPVSESIGQSPSMVAALKTAIADGAVLNQEGYTHQYSNVANPYNGVSGDDAEFYRAQCATTATPPYTYQAPC